MNDLTYMCMVMLMIGKHLHTRLLDVCVCVRMSVARSPEARRGVPVDLTRHKERAYCGRAVISQSQRQSNNYDRSNSRVQARMAKQRR